MSETDVAIAASLESLLHAFDLDEVGTDTYSAVSEPDRFDHIFGGQTLGQALLAAGATVPDKVPHSLHAYFVQTGAAGEPIDLAVDRIRDGRTMATRQVTVTQPGRTLMTAIASFHDNPESPRMAQRPVSVPGPDELRSLADWSYAAPEDVRDGAMRWVTSPPPLEFRMGEAPYFISGTRAEGTRSHWMRLPSGAGDSPLMHAALLLYASDYFLLDMALREHPDDLDTNRLRAYSLDHSIWFHRPARFDDWHVHTQDLITVVGNRGFTRGSIRDSHGDLVASVTQEVIVQQ